MCNTTSCINNRLIFRIKNQETSFLSIHIQNDENHSAVRASHLPRRSAFGFRGPPGTRLLVLGFSVSDARLNSSEISVSDARLNSYGISASDARLNSAGISVSDTRLNSPGN